jgi:hypothetical protein
VRASAAPDAESGEHLENPLARAGDDRALAADDDRALHQLGVLEQKRGHLFRGLVIVRAQAELGEALVLPNEVRRRRVENAKNSLETRAIERLLQIFDGIELDAALAQNLDRAARLASTRVVIQS